MRVVPHVRFCGGAAGNHGHYSNSFGAAGSARYRASGHGMLKARADAGSRDGHAVVTPRAPRSAAVPTSGTRVVRRRDLSPMKPVRTAAISGLELTCPQ